MQYNYREGLFNFCEILQNEGHPFLVKLYLIALSVIVKLCVANSWMFISRIKKKF